jgi:hypothetical protein
VFGKKIFDTDGVTLSRRFWAAFARRISKADPTHSATKNPLSINISNKPMSFSVISATL